MVRETAAHANCIEVILSLLQKAFCRSFFVVGDVLRFSCNCQHFFVLSF